MNVRRETLWFGRMWVSGQHGAAGLPTGSASCSASSCSPVSLFLPKVFHLTWTSSDEHESTVCCRHRGGEELLTLKSEGIFLCFALKPVQLCCLDHSLGFITQASRYTRQDIRSWNQPPWWFLAGGRRRHVPGPPWSADCFLRATTVGPKCCCVSLDKRHSWKKHTGLHWIHSLFYILLKKKQLNF